MEVENLVIYTMSLDLSKRIWLDVAGWNYFAKDTIGKQLIRASDSIAANISEGYGRYHYKEEKLFLYYARGSLSETKTFLTLAFQRNLIDKMQYDDYISHINTIGRKLNRFIKSIGTGHAT